MSSIYTEDSDESENEEEASTLRKMTPNTREDFRKNASFLVCLSAAVTLFIFTLLGALVFYFVERNSEHEYQPDHSKCLEMLKIGTKITRELRGKVEKCLKKDAKIDSFGKSLFFSWTLYSTVGYGNLYPSSSLGRGITAAYSVLMIPVYIAFKFEFGTIVARFLLFLSNWFIWALRIVYKKLCRLVRRHEIHRETRSILLLHTNRDYMIFVSSLILCTVSLLASSLIFSSVEDISFPSAVYFGVITMSLIGIGDIVPSNLAWFTAYSVFFLVSDVLSNHIFYFCQARIRVFFHFIARKVLLLRERPGNSMSINHVPVINTQCMPTQKTDLKNQEGDDVMDCEKLEVDKDEKLLSSLSTSRPTQ